MSDSCLVFFSCYFFKVPPDYEDNAVIASPRHALSGLLSGELLSDELGSHGVGCTAGYMSSFAVERYMVPRCGKCTKEPCITYVLFKILGMININDILLVG